MKLVSQIHSLLEEGKDAMAAFKDIEAYLKKNKISYEVDVSDKGPSFVGLPKEYSESERSVKDLIAKIKPRNKILVGPTEINDDEFGIFVRDYSMGD